MAALFSLTEPDIARICHDANRSLRQVLGDDTQSLWEDAPKWQREASLRGVRALVEHPDTTPEALHEAWRAGLEKEGWRFGPVRDSELKIHPCLVAYADLAPEERSKDALFHAIVAALAPYLPREI